jgi:telomerase reverse transcriptase
MELPDTDEASYTASTSSSSAPLITQKAAVTRHDVRHIPQVINAQTSTQNTKAEQRANLTDYATPVASVSAFCKAVIQNLVPLEFFGTGEQGYAHQEIILGHVDRFTRLRRFENLSLDDICRSIRVGRL